MANFCRWARWIAVAVLLICGKAIAQDLLVPQQQAAAIDSVSGMEPLGGVYVHDSAIALDKMALAQRLERLQEWTKSSEIYQEITEKYRDRVVPSHVDDQGVIDQYTSVLTLVNEHLRAWPAEGLNVYRARYELTAQNLVAQASGDDLGPLHEAFSRYFLTDSGKTAGLKLIDAYFEQGDFSAAAWIGQQLLLHPSLAGQRPMVVFRVGLAAHMSQETDLAQAALSELQNKYPAAVGTVGGRDVVLAKELADDFSRITPSTYARAGGGEGAEQVDSWPMPGGDATRGKISISTARPGAKLYSVDISQPAWNNIADPSLRQRLASQDQTWRREGAALGIVPACDRGELFFQDNSQVYALNLEDGSPLPQWVHTYPASQGRYVVPNAAILPTWHDLSLTLTDSAVLAVMDLPDPLSQVSGMASSQGGRLVCLDRASGKANWTFSATDLADPNLQDLVLGGSPLVEGNNVYLAARAAKGTGYEDCYVLCLDLSSGAYRWSCYIASAASSQPLIMDPNRNMVPAADAPTHLAYAGGRIFVSTDLGAVAAVDAFSGTIAWLDVYREADEAVSPNMAMGMRMPFGFNPGDDMDTPIAPEPWTIGAPIVRDGNVFILPSDGKYILIYDAGSGRVINKLAKDRCCFTYSDVGAEDTSLYEPNQLLGVLDGVSINDQGTDRPQDLLIVATPNRVCAIKWRQYDAADPRAAIAWASMPYREHAPGHTIRGHTFITADSVYIPAAWALCRVALHNGQIVETYPAGVDASWPDGEGPGNVIVCGDHVVVAGDQHVSVYSDLTLARAKLDQLVSAAPTDPMVRLRYAEVMFLANRPDLAMAKLDEAIGLLGDEPESKATQRAVNDALNFATTLARNDGDARIVNGLFDRASRLVGTAEQQVDLLMARASYAHAKHDLAAAIKFYQDILARPELRNAPAPSEQPSDQASISPTDDQDAPLQAGQAAEAQVAAILSEPGGPAAYQPFEQAAKAETAAAGAALDANRLLAVALMYPNSTAAPQARLAAADTFESKGQAIEATRVLRQIYREHPASKSLILQALARNYAKIPGRLEAAASRLAAAARLDPGGVLVKPMTLPDGNVLSNVTLSQATDVLRTLVAKNAMRAADFPTFGLPSHAAEQSYYAHNQRPLPPLMAGANQIDNVGKLLVPARAFSRGDRVVTWTSGIGLSIYPIQESVPLGIDADIQDEPRGVAWVNNGANLLVWTDDLALLVAGKDGQTQWRLPLASLPETAALPRATPVAPLNPVIAPMDQLARRRFLRQRLLLGRNPRIFVRGGMVMPGVRLNNPPPPEAASPGGEETFTNLLPVGDVVLAWTSTGRVAAIDLSGGGILWQTRVAGHAIDRLVANGDFTVIMAADETAVQLVVLDTSSGQMLARKAVAPDDVSQCPINLALGDDDTLVCSLCDRLVMYDLSEIGTDRTLDQTGVQTPASPDKPYLFQGMTQPDQLLIHAGQVLALCDSGTSLRGYFAEKAELREYLRTDSDGPIVVQMILPTGEGDNQTQLLLGDRYVYAWGPRSIVAYNLEHPEVGWGPRYMDNFGTTSQIWLGKDYLLIFNAPASEAKTAGGASRWWIYAFSRAIAGEKPVPTESGVWVYQWRFSEPRGVIAWQGVDGGFCYLGGDHKLRMLLGNRKPGETGNP